MKQTTRSRGSAAVMAMIMVVSTMTVAIVMVKLSGAVRTKQTRLESNRIVKNAFDGGVDYVRDMASRGILRLPQTVTFTMGGVQETIVLTDVSGTVVSIGGISISTAAPTILVDATLVYKGGSYRMQKVIGRGLLSTVWQYALYCDSSLTSVRSVVTGSPGLGADAWFAGNLTLADPATHFGGDLTCTGAILPPTFSVDGTKKSLSPAIAFPVVVNATYLAAATLSLPVNTTLTGYSFPASSAAGYPVLYEDVGLTVSGSFTGSGVIYVAGNATISGSITKSSSDRLVIIVQGNISIAAAAITVDAYIFCAGTVTVAAGGPNLTLPSGIVTHNLTLNRNLTAAFDTYVRDNPAEAYRLKMPGVWP